MKNAVLPLRMDEETRDEIRAVARKSRLSQLQVIRIALKSGLADFRRVDCDLAGVLSFMRSHRGLMVAHRERAGRLR